MNKKGISLVVLCITIVVGLILVSASISDLNFNTKEAKLSKFVYDISTLEDALKSYYILNNELPKNSEVLTKETLQSYQNDNELYVEIAKNKDENSEFYILDLNKINVEKNENTKEDWNQYVFSYPNFNVYYLKGEKINKVKYFSITDKVDEKILKKSNVSLDSSVISLKEGSAFKVIYDGSNFKNKLDIAVEYDRNNYTLDISVFDSNNNVKKISKVNGEKKFEKASNIDSTLSNTSIEKILFELKNSNSEVVAKETIITSNYDPFTPTISNDKIDTYTDMKVLTFDVLDVGKSGLKEIRYEYLAKNEEKNIEYMKTKSKVIDATNILNGKSSIKIPKESYGIQVIAIDKADNISNIFIKSNF